MTNVNGIQVLGRDEIMATCPSFYATQPHHEVSDKYTPVSTRDVAMRLWDHGWMPTSAEERKVRDSSKKGLTHHIVRFTHRDMIMDGGDRIEIVATNSHDRSSALQLLAGIFRMVCSNGLIAQTSDMGNIRVRHIGDIDEQVMLAADQIGEHAGLIAGRVDEMKAIDLSPDEQGVFAMGAHSYLYGDNAETYNWNQAPDANVAPIRPDQLLRANRYDDRKADLWTIFNVVQENVMKGGLRGRAATGRRVRTREVKSIERNVKINKALWTLATEMAKLKTAA